MYSLSVVLNTQGMPRALRSVPPPLDATAKREQDRLLAAFGANLRELRHERLLTIEQLAEAAGLHANYVGSVERGERNLSLFNLWRIAAGLGLQVPEVVKSLPARKHKHAAQRSR